MQNVVKSSGASTSAVEQMLRRIQGEFVEMPGLRLTLAQAQRLWNVDKVVCESLLRALVDVQFLVRTVDGAFVRRTDVLLPSTRRVA